MKQVIFIVLSSMILTMSYGQKDFEKIEFENYNPVWIHFVKDVGLENYKDTIFGTNYDGLSHLYPVIIKRINGQTMFVLYPHFIKNIQTGRVLEIIGGFLEKINLNSGKVLATSYFDIRNNDKKEQPVAIVDGPNGTIDILNLRQQEKLKDKMQHGSLSVYRYDTSDLNLIGRFKPNLKDSLVKVFTTPLPLKDPTLMLRSEDDSYILYNNEITTQKDKFFYGLSRTELNEKGHEVYNTESYQDIEINDYNWFFDMNPFLIGQDTICHPVFLKTYNFDSIYAVLKYYDKELNFIGEKNINDILIRDQIPFVMEPGYKNRLIMKATYSKQPFAFITSYYHINTQGEKLEYFRLPKLYPNPQVLKIHDEPGVLIIAATRDKQMIDVLKTNGNGVVTKIRSFGFNGAFSLSPTSIFQLDDGDVILSASVIDTIPRSQTSYANVLVRFSSKDLGILTTIKSNEDHHEIYVLKPNPASDIISLHFNKDMSGIVTVLNSVGQTVLTTRIKNKRIAPINITSLSTGLYRILVNSDETKKLFVERSFIKQ